MTQAALTQPAARPLPAPTLIFDLDEAPPTASDSRPLLWKDWKADLRFFATAYAAGFVFFLAILS